MSQLNNKQTAKTIIDQLEQSFNMVVMNRKVSIFTYIGAKKGTFVYGEDFVMFQVPKRKKIVITLNGNDLYDVDLYNLNKFEYEKQEKDIYADNLKNVVFRFLGVN